MTVQQQIDAYINAQSESKRSDMQTLHDRISALMPGCRLWYLDGTDENGKIVMNPNIGYGLQTLRYANGSTREFYQIGISANTTGLSVFILGLADKTYLATRYGATLGKAKVTGYCIKFSALKHIDLAVLEAAILDGVEQTARSGSER
jgi:hypothetical protein